MFSRYTGSNRVAYSFRNAVSRMSRSRRRVRDLRRVGNRNLAIGLSVGTVAGIAAGILMAPRKGKEIRHSIAQRTNAFLGDVKATGKQLGAKSSRLWLAGRQSAEGARESIIESAERH